MRAWLQELVKHSLEELPLCPNARFLVLLLCVEELGYPHPHHRHDQQQEGDVKQEHD